MSATVERHYKTYQGFHRAFSRFTYTGELVHWFGTDFGWTTVVSQ